jgi:hypothetical protein
VVVAYSLRHDVEVQRKAIPEVDLRSAKNVTMTWSGRGHWKMNKKTRKKKKAVKAVEKAVKRAMKKGVTGEIVEAAVERAITKVNREKTSRPTAKSKSIKPVRKRKSTRV